MGEDETVVLSVVAIVSNLVAPWQEAVLAHPSVVKHIEKATMHLVAAQIKAPI